ncbi:helix-turn-helix domain-containing protein [Micromonospora sp. NPDC126480]|uniref:helix-turn-helix transcriptional regulator n=1 Tax=Micromonospora sp. NPDC126480 TaxID=3155312 RepID=UPI00331A1C40
MVAAPWPAVTLLVDEVRRALYDYVRRQDHPVTRDEAAATQHISRNLAAFHLDKLVAAGLLNARYAAPAAVPRGRGRTPKVYEAAPGCIALTIPERRYDLIGEILARAVAEDPTDARSAALRVAGQRGAALGRQVGEGEAVVDVLARLGFEPAGEGALIQLRNCPFHQLAAQQTELVCGVNRAFVAGLLDGLGRTDLHARLAPAPGACCVQIRPA